jgi:NAD(P)-dependent dehydrogenase (short-subunit alcohol dehydrogenase family)
MRIMRYGIIGRPGLATTDEASPAFLALAVGEALSMGVEMRLSGKTAIITGAASGIGEATAELFAAEGANVIAVDVDEENGRAVVERITGKGGQATFVAADVSRESDVKAAVDRAVSDNGRLDVVVNNAGIVRFYEIERTELDDWNRVIAINLTGPMLFCKHGVPHLRKTKGTIVNMSSIHATLTGPKMSAYAASKGGISTMTRSLALELGPDGIRVNAILPGYIVTPLFMSDANRVTGGHPEQFISQLEGTVALRRLGQSMDVAKLALFLASDESSYVNGAEFSIDAGASIQL